MLSSSEYNFSISTQLNILTPYFTSPHLSSNMSFLKKLTKEFDGLKSSFSKGDEKKEQKQEGEINSERNHSFERSSKISTGPQYGAPFQPNQQAQQYGQPSYNNQGPPYAGGAPPPGPPSMDPSLPPGWIKQFDSNSQRWYFVEQATGRTQWEPPMPLPQNYGNQNPYPAAGGGLQDPHYDSAPKAKGHGNMGAAAGGLAVGAVGGALMGHALGMSLVTLHIPTIYLFQWIWNINKPPPHPGDDSDSDHGGASHYTSQPSGYGQQQPYPGGGGGGGGGDPSAPPLTGDLPDETRSGSSVSGSEKEDVEEAREDYQEELRKGGSQSDIEEAREEYQEEYEETYED